VIHAIDTNILLDVLIQDPQFCDASADLLARAGAEGALAISAVVYAELSAHFAQDEDLRQFLMDIGIRIEPIDIDVARIAGRAWYAYVATKKDGSARRNELQRKPILADFLIGAHAVAKNYALLTRDTRGLYERYFPSLKCGSSREES